MTQKYPGIVIHSSRDTDGVIDVVQDQVSRSLYFGTPAKQSSMFLHDNAQLALSYTRAMMSFLLFNSQPESILLIGLGGGSLVKFIHRNFPACKIDAIERRENVVKLAYGYFQLPKNENISIHITDAGHYIAATKKRYDAILVDAYDSSGMSDDINNTTFFSNCRDRLTACGVLTANLWRTNKVELKATQQALSDSFGKKVIYLPIQERQNIIALGLRSEKPARKLKNLTSEAKLLGRTLNLELPAYLERLRRNNTAWYERMLGTA